MLVHKEDSTVSSTKMPLSRLFLGSVPDHSISACYHGDSDLPLYSKRRPKGLPEHTNLKKSKSTSHTPGESLIAKRLLARWHSLGDVLSDYPKRIKPRYGVTLRRFIEHSLGQKDKQVSGFLINRREGRSQSGFRENRVQKEPANKPAFSLLYFSGKRRVAETP